MMKASSPIATNARVPPIAAPATSPGEGRAIVSAAAAPGIGSGVGNPLGFAAGVTTEEVLDEASSVWEVDVENVEVVLADDAEGDADETAALFKSAYWMLHLTCDLLALKFAAQLVNRGQHASVVPAASCVQGTGFGSLQTDSWST